MAPSYSDIGIRQALAHRPGPSAGHCWYTSGEAATAHEAPDGGHVVVLGAGYTGMIAAIRTARRTRRRGVRVTIVNPSSRFTERLRMHQIATGQQLPDLRIPDMLAGTGVEFVEGRAEGSTSSAGP